MATKKSSKKTSSKKSGKAKPRSVARKSAKKGAKKSSSRPTAAKRTKKAARRGVKLTLPPLPRSIASPRTARGLKHSEQIAARLIEDAKELVTEVFETARVAAAAASESAVERAQDLGDKVRRNAESILPRPAKVRRVR